MQYTDALAANVSIVLVDTSHPGNIGATARAMKNMGLADLCLVRPRRFPHAEATARASGADDVLARARVVDDLVDAIADATGVYGVTGRQRSLPWPQASAREASAAVVAGGERCCLLFGNEQSGLGNAEMDRCTALVYIPASETYSSLNLAMAVQVLSYELRMAALMADRVLAADGTGPAAPSDSAAATAAQMEALYVHFEHTLMATGFLNPDNPRHLLRRLRRVFNRASLEENEVQILRGILASVDAALAGRGRRP